MISETNWREVLTELMRRRIDEYRKAWDEDFPGMTVEEVANMDTTDKQGPQKNRQRELFRNGEDA